MVRHIRCTDARVTDHRFRGTITHHNKLRPTICGADPTCSDVSRKDGRHLIRFGDVKPEWVADLCGDCRDKVGT